MKDEKIEIIEKKLTNVSLPIMEGYVVDSDWQEEYDLYTLDEIKSGETDLIRKVLYFEFMRESMFSGGKNTFYSENGGETYSKANSLFCKHLHKSMDDAVDALFGKIQRHKDSMLEGGDILK